ncbi:BDNF/NT-3 growth factors receptor-like isoform X2 [Mytilus trossulus]|uniref:BDNF/NT-3 growth factors receptor-like isoform X2 n=1 Tax=Mytilus trossulus TaxID=6551 RepID=UPI0030067BC0
MTNNMTKLADYKECSILDDCLSEQTCHADAELNKNVCYCINTATKADRAGKCTTGDISVPGHGLEQHDVIPIHNIPKNVHGLVPDANNETMSTSHGSKNQTNPTPLSTPHISDIDSTVLLQIFIPITVALLLLFLVAIFIVKRSKACNRKSKRNDKVIRNSEDVQLLDRMNFVNKNPTYFFSERGEKDSKKIPINNIPYDKVTLQDIVGEGAFGQVYRGQNFAENDAGEYVAIKILKDGVSNEVKEDFEREVDIMSAFDHENILKLIGIIQRGPTETPYMVFEYMVHGDLADLLRRNDPAMRSSDRDITLEKTDLIDISTQIANGMTYLTSKHFVHRDLATRNCLVGEGFVVKISDFGMARDVYTCDYYRIGGSRMLPVRWMSPESMKYGRFTTESDIWAFGVVLWEIFSYGRQPYYGHSNEEVVRFLDEGIMLQRPDECPSTIYHIMLGCWKKNPKERIPYQKIHKHLVDFSKEILRNVHHHRPILSSESDP